MSKANQFGKETYTIPVQEECPACGGQGLIEVVGMEHAYGCDGSCKSCPVPVREQEQCKYCEGTGYIPVHKEGYGDDPETYDLEKELIKGVTKLQAENKRLKTLIREIASSGVELDDARMRYILVQIYREDWEAIKEAK